MTEENFIIDSDEKDYTQDIASYTAKENFGIKYLYPWQRLVIANILEAFEYQQLKKSGKLDNKEEADLSGLSEDSFCKGRQIVLLPTGAGKSLCFLIPAKILDGPTMIIYPLLALMSDQQRRMEEGSLQSVTFRGGQTSEEREENFRKLKNGAKIILANPEVLQNKELVNKLKETGIVHIAIDEAHCVSEWGDSFRPSYLTLGEIIKELDPPVITAFTATASPVVLNRVAEILFNGNAHIVRSESDRPNIHYFVEKAAAKEKRVLELAAKEAHPLVVFCSSRNKTEEIARDLNICFGYGTARFYHAGLEKSEKDETEKWFYNSKDGILVVTCAWGMGVDKKDVHTVVHLDAPATSEAYIQEAGRGGRDGSIAKAILVWSPADYKKTKDYKKGSREAALRDFAETTECRRQVLLDSLGAEQAVCAGCDNCNNKLNPASQKKLTDYETALKIIRRVPNFYDAQSLEEKLMDTMNSSSMTIFHRKIWTHKDCAEIVSQLKENNFIRENNNFWKGRLKIVRNKKL